jgi:molybdopterin converting factor small subunit
VREQKNHVGKVMEFKVRILRGSLSEIIGKSEITIRTENDVRVIDVLNLLAEKYGKSFRDYVFRPKTREINSYLIFSINGVNVSSIKGTKTQIEDGNELLILSAAGGG